MRPQQRVEPWQVQYFDRFGDQRDVGAAVFHVHQHRALPVVHIEHAGLERGRGQL